MGIGMSTSGGLVAGSVALSMCPGVRSRRRQSPAPPRSLKGPASSAILNRPGARSGEARGPPLAGALNCTHPDTHV